MIFLEATLHGAMPWVATSHERRSVMVTARSNNHSPCARRSHCFCSDSNSNMRIHPARRQVSYCPKHMSAHLERGNFYEMKPAEWLQELTPAQRAVLEPPYGEDTCTPFRPPRAPPLITARC